MAGADSSAKVHGLHGRDGEYIGVIGEVKDSPCDDQGSQRETEEGEHRGDNGSGEAPTERGREVFHELS